MKAINIFIAMTVIIAGDQLALAHPGPRVWIGNVSGKLTTYTSDNDLAPTTYTPQRVFVGGIDQDSLQANGRLDEYPVPGTNFFATDFPGYQVRLDHQGDGGGGGINFGTTFSFRIAGPLLIFNDINLGGGSASGYFVTSALMFSGTGHVPQIGLVLSGGSSTVITGNDVVNGYSFYAYNSATDHAHLIATLLPNGSFPSDGSAPGDGPHVVYAVPFVLTAGGYSESQEFYVLYGRDIGYLSDGPQQQVFLDAVTAAQAMLLNPGDMDCSGALTLADIPVFVQALIDPTGYGAAHPGCSVYQADFNRDGRVDGLDCQQFVKALAP